MKTILISVLTLLSTSAFAFSNPQIRACHQKNGEFIVTALGQDQIGLCKINNSYVGALDLMNYNVQFITKSIENYIQNNTICISYKKSLIISDSGTQKMFCVFEDGSLMDLETLNTGRNSIINQALNSILGLQ
jgi:hypothetical protein